MTSTVTVRSNCPPEATGFASLTTPVVVIARSTVCGTLASLGPKWASPPYWACTL
jgi:hypothetical protein